MSDNNQGTGWIWKVFWILLVITGVEVSVAKIFFKKRQEKIIGKSSSITLYIF